MDFFIEGFTTEVTGLVMHEAFTEATVKVEGGLAGYLDIQDFELPGISISSCTGAIHRDIDIMVKYAEEDRNNISFCAPMKIGGGVSGILEGMKPFDLKEKHYAFLYYPHEKGIHRLKAGGPFNFISIKLNIEKMNEYLYDEESWLYHIMPAVNKHQTSLFTLNASLLDTMLEKALQGILQCPFNGITKRLFLEGKTLELLSYSIAALEPVSRNVSHGLSERDRRKLADIKRYLDNNYLQDLSLKLLCSEFGINEFKLKSGFKNLYGETVFGYVLEQKMQLAYKQLDDGEESIADLSDMLGYNHQGNFTVAFKKRFHVNPLQIRNNKGVISLLK
jgi:AraC-like DNA-binding protein